MKQILLTLSLIAFAVTLSAQTNVSGLINVDSTFSLAGSPYTVTSSLIVGSGATLTLETGVVVKVADNQNILVRGTLTGNGATITSSKVTPAAGDWSYIQVGDGSFQGTLDLTDCQVAYANYIYVYDGALVLNNTNLQNFNQYGVYARGTTSTSITGGSITTNSSYASSYGRGIYALDNSSVSLTGTSISNFNIGVGPYAGNTNITSDNVSISNCTYGYSVYNDDTLNITSTNVTGTTYPIYYNGPGKLYYSGTNIFTGNTYNVACVGFYTLTTSWNLATLNIPYYFPSGFSTNSGTTFTIGSNNIIKTASSINIYGTLDAEANVDESISFTSFNDDNWGGDSNNDGTATAPTWQSWGGLNFYNATSSASSLLRCKIRYGGSGYRGGINLYNASPTVNSCDITSNYYGAYFSGTSNPNFTNNIIGSSAVTPIAMSFEANPMFSNNELSFSDNQYDAIGLLGGILSADATISQRSFNGIDNITYFMLAEIEVPADRTLTINPGVVIKSANYSYNILVKGTLIADGTAIEPIVFTSVKDDNFGNPSDTNKDGTTSTPAIGDFGGIVFTPTSSNSSSVTYSKLKYARAYDEYFYNRWMGNAAIVTINVSPTISHNEIKDVNYGIMAFEASNPTISDNQMVNVVYTPFAISGSADPVFSNNTFLNCGWNAIGLLGGNVTQNGTIRKRDISGYTNITYVLLEQMTITENTYIEVEAGVVIKIAGVSIIVHGGFKANGTVDNKIIFTSTQDDNSGNPFDTNGDGNATSAAPGNWQRIRFEESSDDSYCQINHAEIRYGGNTYYYYHYSNLEFNNASPTISNTLVGQSSEYGLRIEGNSAPVFDNVIIQNCGFDPIGMSLTSNPQFNNMTFTANRSKGLAIIDNTLSSDATLISRDVAGIENIAYILNYSLTIGSNATLTINPKVVIKTNSYAIYVDGALIANGTQDNNITFTSIQDDSSGGDTNDDGNNSVPAAGNWSGIEFRASGIGNTNLLKNTNVRYATNAVRFNNVAGTADSCIIELASSNAFHILGAANPVISNNQLFNIGDAPVYLSMFSEPVFSNNTMANIGTYALRVAPETYSQTATFPFRSFAGYDSITYELNGTYTINDGTTITIPAGMVFKTGKYIYYYNYETANFTVNGTLNIEGTQANPVVFTSFYDDQYGNPLDNGLDGNAPVPVKNSTWFIFNNVSNDASIINHALIKHSNYGIELKSASPNITNSRFENLGRGITMNGVSEPVISDNVFHNLQYSPMTISLVAYPLNTDNNVISGTTYKVIEVNYETLTQDVTLPKRNFGGKVNIPYLFNSYTIGTGSILTIEPGVICKFLNAGITVQKGLIAQGTSGQGNQIVFTSFYDDYYGGDSNSDGTYQQAGSGQWYGITYENTAIDASCILDYCIVKYAHTYYPAIKANSSSPTITNSAFIQNGAGILVTGSGNPIINNCDFYNNTDYAVKNNDLTFVIDATNNWWGNNSGPTHTGNPDGTGQIVSDGVDYTPWLTNGANNPVMGDVSLNGMIQAYDASLVLQHTVSAITLDANQLEVADVSGNGGVDAVSAYDASLILQYNVGLIKTFPATENFKMGTLPVGSDVELVVENVMAELGETITIPVSVSNVTDIFALQLAITFDADLLTFSGLEQTTLTSSHNFVANHGNGNIIISTAGTAPLDSNGVLANLLFTVNSNVEGIIHSPLTVSKFLANDKNLTATAINGEATIFGSITSVSDPSETAFEVYPNPFTDNLTINYSVSEPSAVSIAVYNTNGQMVSELANQITEAGNYHVTWNGVGTNGIKLSSGLYLIKLQIGGTTKTLKIQMQ